MKRKMICTLILIIIFAMLLPGCAASQPPADKEDPSVSLRIMSLKGPTSMGLAGLYGSVEDGTALQSYTYSIVTGADEITAALVSGQTDIAALPANAAAALYQKAGGFSVVAINTLGVLYLIENGESIRSIEDLSGRTVYLTGKGTTPEYTLRHLLNAAGIEESVTLEFCSEASEVVARLQENAVSLALLPQPFVTTALIQNTELRIALDLNEVWETLCPGTLLVTGVTVVRDEVLAEHPQQISDFMSEYDASVRLCSEDPDAAAEQVVRCGILGSTAVAKKALPGCGIDLITGESMKTALSGYLQTLFDRNPNAVGGKMPEDAFYYIP